MGLIECPNCKKETFDDYKCQCCKYVLKERKHPFDEEKYEILKAEYKKNPHKSLVLKFGLEKCGMDLTECKKIVDYIADEKYDEDNFISKQNFYDYGSGIYKFSFFQYFIRNLAYKIIIALFLFYFVREAKELTTTIVSFIIFTMWCIMSIYSLFKATTMTVLFESEKIEYYRRSSTFTAPGGSGYEDRRTGIHFEDRMDKRITYKIKQILKIQETFFSIKIQGNVQYEVLKFLESGKNRVLKDKITDSVRIPKYFKNNNDLIINLKKHLPNNKK